MKLIRLLLFMCLIIGVGSLIQCEMYGNHDGSSKDTDSDSPPW